MLEADFDVSVAPVVKFNACASVSGVRLGIVLTVSYHVWTVGGSSA